MKKLLLLLLLAFPASVMAQETIYQYTTVPITYEEQNFLNLNQTQEGSNFGDDEVRQIDIGFDFTFYGQTFNTLYLSNNGLLSFISPNNGCCSGEPLPTSSLYDYSIFFLWTDLSNIETFNPYISSYGTEGNRRLTIGFYDMPVYYDSLLTSTFEISLWEGTNYVFLNYGDLNTGDRTITSGLQGNSLLGEYTQLYYGNDATSTLSNTSWLFYSNVYIDPGPENPEEPPPPPPEEPQSPEVNCAIQFFDPSCQLADNTQQVNDPVVEEQFFSEERVVATETETPIELEQQTISVEKIEETLVAENREVTVENIEAQSSSAETLDSSILDLVLAIVQDTGSAPATSTTQSSSQSAVASSISSFGSESSVDSQQQDFTMIEEQSSAVMIAESTQDFQQQDIVNEFGQIQVLGSEFTQQQFDTFDENKIIESILASGNQQEFSKQEETETFSEPLVVMVDMAQSQSGFNPVFSIANLEMAGVLNQREEKSDAEKRADQVIAANQEQQDAINANYMDADQSGILAAMDTGTDFTQYRNTMLRDVDFYKPEDIYKNVVYRDNVRGMYFLEKGSTDTYKKMVDEQYK